MTFSQDRQLKAIVFSDVVDSSIKIFADELIAVQQIKDDLALIREQLQGHGGSLVKSLGDGLLMTFDAPTQALDFIQVVISQLKDRRRSSLDHRFGLHTGEIYADGDDILGQGVHLASRLQTVSPVNGVAFVRSTYDLIDTSYRRLANKRGMVELKGLPQPMEVFTLSQEQFVGTSEAALADARNLPELLANTAYDVERPMGRSVQQNTWLLRERQRDRHAVLKLVPADARLVEALKLEAATLDRLRHPRIPRIVDAFDCSGLFCFIQEYIPGASLNGSLDLLRRKQRIGGLLRQILELLEVVHSVGLMHGDIHPANLIPDAEGGSLFLVDFSLLRARINARREDSGSFDASVSEMGRPYFSAPERARFGRLAPAADLYALGLTAFTLYTGQNPEALFDQSLGAWSFDGVDPEVVRWLEPLLQESPAQRVQNAADALRLLDQPVPAASAVTPTPTLRFTKGLNKERLQAELITTYGPMVDLLLEQQPCQIPADQVANLVTRLVTAGLRPDDVTRAVSAAELQTPTSEPISDVPMAVVDSSETESEQATHSPRMLLQQEIGPIADLLWTDAMDAAWRQGPEYVRPLLEAAGVSRGSIDHFLREVDSLQLSQIPAFSSLEPPKREIAPEQKVEKVESADLERQLTELIGPIGAQLFAEVQDLPIGEQRKVLLERLQSFGVAEDVLQTFR